MLHEAHLGLFGEGIRTEGVSMAAWEADGRRTGAPAGPASCGAPADPCGGAPEVRGPDRLPAPAGVEGRPETPEPLGRRRSEGPSATWRTAGTATTAGNGRPGPSGRRTAMNPTRTAPAETVGALSPATDLSHPCGSECYTEQTLLRPLGSPEQTDQIVERPDPVPFDPGANSIDVGFPAIVLQVFEQRFKDFLPDLRYPVFVQAEHVELLGDAGQCRGLTREPHGGSISPGAGSR